MQQSSQLQLCVGAGTRSWDFSRFVSELSEWEKFNVSYLLAHLEKMDVRKRKSVESCFKMAEAVKSEALMVKSALSEVLFSAFANLSTEGKRRGGREGEEEWDEKVIREASAWMSVNVDKFCQVMGNALPMHNTTNKKEDSMCFVVQETIKQILDKTQEDLISLRTLVDKERDDIANLEKIREKKRSLERKLRILQQDETIILQSLSLGRQKKINVLESHSSKLREKETRARKFFDKSSGGVTESLLNSGPNPISPCELVKFLKTTAIPNMESIYLTAVKVESESCDNNDVTNSQDEIRTAAERFFETYQAILFDRSIPSHHSSSATALRKEILELKPEYKSLEPLLSLVKKSHKLKSENFRMMGCVLFTKELASVLEGCPSIMKIIDAKKNAIKTESLEKLKTVVRNCTEELMNELKSSGKMLNSSSIVSGSSFGNNIDNLANFGKEDCGYDLQNNATESSPHFCANIDTIESSLCNSIAPFDEVQWNNERVAQHRDYCYDDVAIAIKKEPNHPDSNFFSKNSTGFPLSFASPPPPPPPSLPTSFKGLNGATFKGHVTSDYATSNTMAPGEEGMSLFHRLRNNLEPPQPVFVNPTKVPPNATARTLVVPTENSFSIVKKTNPSSSRSACALGSKKVRANSAGAGADFVSSTMTTATTTALVTPTTRGMYPEDERTGLEIKKAMIEAVNDLKRKYMAEAKKCFDPNDVNDWPSIKRFKETFGMVVLKVDDKTASTFPLKSVNKDARETMTATTTNVVASIPENDGGDGIDIPFKISSRLKKTRSTTDLVDFCMIPDVECAVKSLSCSTTCPNDEKEDELDHVFVIEKEGRHESILCESLQFALDKKLEASSSGCDINKGVSIPNLDVVLTNIYSVNIGDQSRRATRSRRHFEYDFKTACNWVVAQIIEEVRTAYDFQRKIRRHHGDATSKGGIFAGLLDYELDLYAQKRVTMSCKLLEEKVLPKLELSRTLLSRKILPSPFLPSSGDSSISSSHGREENAEVARRTDKTTEENLDWVPWYMSSRSLSSSNVKKSRYNDRAFLNGSFVNVKGEEENDDENLDEDYCYDDENGLRRVMNGRKRMKLENGAAKKVTTKAAIGGRRFEGSRKNDTRLATNNRGGSKKKTNSGLRNAEKQDAASRNQSQEQRKKQEEEHEFSCLSDWGNSFEMCSLNVFFPGDHSTLRRYFGDRWGTEEQHKDAGFGSSSLSSPGYNSSPASFSSFTRPVGVKKGGRAGAGANLSATSNSAMIISGNRKRNFFAANRDSKANSSSRSKGSGRDATLASSTTSRGTTKRTPANNKKTGTVAVKKTKKMSLMPSNFFTNDVQGGVHNGYKYRSTILEYENKEIASKKAASSIKPSEVRSSDMLQQKVNTNEYFDGKPLFNFGFETPHSAQDSSSSATTVENSAFAPPSLSPSLQPSLPAFSKEDFVLLGEGEGKREDLFVNETNVHPSSHIGSCWVLRKCAEKAWLLGTNLLNVLGLNPKDVSELEEILERIDLISEAQGFVISHQSHTYGVKEIPFNHCETSVVDTDDRKEGKCYHNDDDNDDGGDGDDGDDYYDEEIVFCGCKMNETYFGADERANYPEFQMQERAWRDAPGYAPPSPKKKNVKRTKTKRSLNNNNNNNGVNSDGRGKKLHDDDISLSLSRAGDDSLFRSLANNDNNGTSMTLCGDLKLENECGHQYKITIKEEKEKYNKEEEEEEEEEELLYSHVDNRNKKGRPPKFKFFSKDPRKFVANGKNDDRMEQDDGDGYGDQSLRFVKIKEEEKEKEKSKGVDSVQMAAETVTVGDGDFAYKNTKINTTTSSSLSEPEEDPNKAQVMPVHASIPLMAECMGVVSVKEGMVVSLDSKDYVSKVNFSSSGEGGKSDLEDGDGDASASTSAEAVDFSSEVNRAFRQYDENNTTYQGFLSILAGHSLNLVPGMHDEKVLSLFVECCNHVYREHVIKKGHSNAKRSKKIMMDIVDCLAAELPTIPVDMQAGSICIWDSKLPVGFRRYNFKKEQGDSVSTTATANNNLNRNKKSNKSKRNIENTCFRCGHKKKTAIAESKESLIKNEDKDITTPVLETDYSRSKYNTARFFASTKSLGSNDNVEKNKDKVTVSDATMTGGGGNNGTRMANMDLKYDAMPQFGMGFYCCLEESAIRNGVLYKNPPESSIEDNNDGGGPKQRLSEKEVSLKSRMMSRIFHSHPEDNCVNEIYFSGCTFRKTVLWNKSLSPDGKVVSWYGYKIPVSESGLDELVGLTEIKKVPCFGPSDSPCGFSTLMLEKNGPEKAARFYMGSESIPDPGSSVKAVVASCASNLLKEETEMGVLKNLGEFKKYGTVNRFRRALSDSASFFDALPVTKPSLSSSSVAAAAAVSAAKKSTNANPSSPPKKKATVSNKSSPSSPSLRLTKKGETQRDNSELSERFLRLNSARKGVFGSRYDKAYPSSFTTNEILYGDSENCIKGEWGWKAEQRAFALHQPYLSTLSSSPSLFVRPSSPLYLTRSFQRCGDFSESDLVLDIPRLGSSKYGRRDARISFESRCSRVVRSVEELSLMYVEVDGNKYDTNGDDGGANFKEELFVLKKLCDKKAGEFSRRVSALLLDPDDKADDVFQIGFYLLETIKRALIGCFAMTNLKFDEYYVTNVVKQTLEFDPEKPDTRWADILGHHHSFLSHLEYAQLALCGDNGYAFTNLPVPEERSFALLEALDKSFRNEPAYLALEDLLPKSWVRAAAEASATGGVAESIPFNLVYDASSFVSSQAYLSNHGTFEMLSCLHDLLSFLVALNDRVLFKNCQKVLGMKCINEKLPKT